VSDRCRAAIRAILERARVRRTPRRKPDLERGRTVYLEACAACHATDGSGKDAPAAMDPPPPDILHPRKNWTPYEMFNRITYGGAETAMPTFKEGLGESNRWDVVFYLFAERWPPCTAPVPPMRASELALLGDFELSNMFPYGAAACLRRAFLPPADDGRSRR
jgi:high-affinity iron transporter